MPAAAARSRRPQQQRATAHVARSRKLCWEDHPRAKDRQQRVEAFSRGDTPREDDFARAIRRQFEGKEEGLICRQRSGTANGFVFVSIDDETGIANAIVMPQLFEQYRLLISEEPFLVITRTLQDLGKVIHTKTETVEAIRASGLPAASSHDFT